MNEIPHLSDPILTKIFQNLNFTDLKNCRLVSHNWNKLITESNEFLTSGIFHVSLDSHDHRDILFQTKVQWPYVRLLQDKQTFEIAHESANFKNFNEPPPFFHFIKTLEFYQCTLSGEVIRAILIHCLLIQHLVVTKCEFPDPDPPMSDSESKPSTTEHDFFISTISSMRSFTVYGIENLTPIINFLDCLIQWKAKNIQFLKIYFNPNGDYVPSYESSNFLIFLQRLISNNILTLEYLVLDLRCTEILNEFGHYVLRELQPYYEHLKLKVFKLAQPIWGGDDSREPNGNVSITSESQYFMMTFGEFLSKQTQLKSIAFPHLANLGGLENRRWQILEQVPKSIEKIRVPSANYIRRNCLKMFTNLKVFCIGEKTIGGPGQVLQPCKFNYDFRQGVVKRNLSKVHTLEIYSKIIYEPGNLHHILEKFPFLTTFKFDCFCPLFNDRDVQSIIKHLKNLRELSIVHCELMTDAGISGLPVQLCHQLYSLGTIYTHDDLLTTKDLYGSQGSGKPLSDLKCLRSLKLVGKSGISDVGILFGIRFQDLRDLHLPENEQITEWGIQKIGELNPCLESLILTGLTTTAASAFTQLLNKHQRIQKDKSNVIGQSDKTNGNGSGSVNTLANSSMLSAVLFTKEKS